MVCAPNRFPFPYTRTCTMDKPINQLRRAAFLLLLITSITTTLAGCAELGAREAAQISAPGGDVGLGWQAIQDYGCHSCHLVPGVPGANSLVGPPLTGWAERRYIAGVLPNTPAYLIQWLRYPQAIQPGTAMPNMGVTEQDARHIAAYLYTLKQDDGFNFSHLFSGFTGIIANGDAQASGE